MLSRHFLRSKVLQAVYAAENDPTESVFMLKRFDSQIDHLNMLGIWQLSTLTEIATVAQEMLDEGKAKFIPTATDLNPSYCLPENPFICTLANNYDFRSFSERYCVNWSNDQELFRKVFSELRKVDFYVAYEKRVAADDKAPDEDFQFVLQVFKYLINNDSLRENVFCRYLLWEDDFDQIAQYNFMMLKSISADFNESTQLRLMYDKRENKDVEAYEFARQLLVDTLKNRQANDELIRTHLRNWEFERIALMDVLLINMAINELVGFPSIPERVTVDEYIELSKEFSTSKSKLFINGILDKLIIELRAAGRIEKMGRGLYVPKSEN